MSNGNCNTALNKAVTFCKHQHVTLSIKNCHKVRREEANKGRTQVMKATK